MKTILDLAKENNINKVCIDGLIYDIRQVNKQLFNIVPLKIDILNNTIFNEPILYASTYDCYIDTDIILKGER